MRVQLRSQRMRSLLRSLFQEESRQDVCAPGRSLLVVLFVLLAFLVIPAQARQKRAATKKGLLGQQQKAKAAESQPPLLDRELFFGDPEIIAAQLSPDGQFIAFIKPYKGTRNVWVKRTSEPFERAKPVTADLKRPIPTYLWSRDGRYILYIQDQDGDENYNVYAVSPADTPATGKEVPTARNITDAKGIRAAFNSLPKTDPDGVFIGMNDRDAAWHDLYKVKISTGERTLIRKNTDRIAGWLFDLQDKPKLATRVAENGDSEVLRVDENGFTKIYSCTVVESCQPTRFHKDNKRVYMITNKGDVDLTRLILFDPATGKEELVESDPLNRVDFGGASFSELTDDVISTTYEDERKRTYFKSKAWEADYNILRNKLLNKDIAMDSITHDEQLILVSAVSDREPGETFLFDRRTKKLTLQYRVYEKMPREHLAEVKPISFKSSDGLEIPAFLSLPKGVPAKNLPLVVVPHGGPWYRDSWGYDPLAQFLANRGYAVLQPNFRGSTGYGKKFLNAANNEWGQKMQDDITWGVRRLVADGIVDPRRVGIMGGSYGGYATLAGLAFTPDVYAAGVALFGPSNLITLLDSIPPYWEFIRKLFHVRMGDPSTPEGKAQLERQSPLNSAARIKAPLLVVQGANDARVKKTESDQIVVALRERAFPVEYLIAPDEGHGFAKPVNNLATFAAAEKFLSKHIGGRYQESMTSEVAQKLKELNVDVKTVEMPKRIEAGASSPKPAVGLNPGVANYKAGIQVAGQTIAMTVVREIKEEGGAWVVTENAQTPQGTISDASVLEMDSLVLRKRSIKQGPVEINLEVKNGKVTGTMMVNGQSRPIEVDAGGALFADGAGANDVIATLPLTEGYTTTFRNFDVQTQKAAVKQLKVVGVESVTVPAGTFDAFKVELTSAEDPGKTTLWIARDSRRVVKISAVLAQLNGAILTSELTKQ